MVSDVDFYLHYSFCAPTILNTTSLSLAWSPLICVYPGDHGVDLFCLDSTIQWFLGCPKISKKKKTNNTEANGEKWRSTVENNVVLPDFWTTRSSILHGSNHHLFDVLFGIFWSKSIKSRQLFEIIVEHPSVVNSFKKSLSNPNCR